jgi:hypothetical protein
MFHDIGGVTVVPDPCRTCTRPFSCSIFTASRTTVRLTEKVSHRAGSGGNGVPGACTPRTMRSTSSAATALARLAGRSTHAGGADATALDCPAAVISPPLALREGPHAAQYRAGRALT